MLSQLSRNLNITIVGGSIPERSGDRIFNTCCVFGTDGNLKAKHRKVLLLSFQFLLLCVCVSVYMVIHTLSTLFNDSDVK